MQHRSLEICPITVLFDKKSSIHKSRLSMTRCCTVSTELCNFPDVMMYRLTSNSSLDISWRCVPISHSGRQIQQRHQPASWASWCSIRQNRTIKDRSARRSPRPFRPVRQADGKTRRWSPEHIWAFQYAYLPRYHHHPRHFQNERQ